MENVKKIYVVMGPTACGKSDFAVQLAKMVQGEVVNFDSMQIYQDVSLLTARPTSETMQGVPHHLYGYEDAFSQGRVTDWLSRAVPLLYKIETPILVGGTGLYIKALTEGLSKIPDIPNDIRTKVRELSVVELKKQLPDFPYPDKQRLQRALEILWATGKNIGYWQKQPKEKPFSGVFETILILPDRKKTYLQCNYRFNQMVKQGANEQVIELLGKNPQKTGGVFQAIGVKELILYQEGKISLDQAIKMAQQATRHYAKRQITWFSHQIQPVFTLKTAQIKDYIAIQNIYKKNKR